MKTNSPKSLRMAATALATTLLAGSPSIPSVRAATVDWNGASTTWATGTNWDGEVAPVNDLTSDIARFNLASYAALPNAGTTSISGLIFGDGVTGTGALTLAGTALSIGSNGMVMNTNAGAVTVSSAIRLGANQTWTNNSANDLTISGAVTNAGNATPYTLKLAGSGAITLSGVVSNGGGVGTTAIEIEKTTGIATLRGANTFSGGVVVKSGTLAIAASGSALGTGTLTLGASSGNADVTLLTAVTSSNDIYIAGGGTGLIKIASTASNRTNGSVTLANNLNLEVGTAGLAFGGGFSGTGNILISSSGSGLANGVAFDGLVNISGTITNESRNTAAISMRGVGSNVTKLIQKSENSGITVTTNALQVNSGGTTLEVTETAKKVINVQAGVTGTGDLILKLDSSIIAGIEGFGGIQFSGGVINHQGSIINRGTGSALNNYIGFAAQIGSNVSLIKQESATSRMLFRGIINTNSEATIFQNDGGAKIEVNSFSSGTGNIVLKNNTATDDGVGLIFSAASVPGAVLNHSGLVINSGTGTGSAILSTPLGANVTGVVQNSTTSMLRMYGSNPLFTGDTTVLSGTLWVGKGDTLSQSTLDMGSGGNSTVRFTNTTGGTVTFSTFELGGLKGSNNLDTGTGNTLQIGANGKDTVYSGVLSGASGKLTKVGSGTLVLTANNTYTNTTTITAGTLLVNTAQVAGNSGTGTGNVAVTGGALGGIGIMRPGTGNAITVSDGAFIAPGDRLNGPLGALVLDGGGTSASLLTMQEGAKFSFRLGENFESDRIDLWNYAGASDFVRNSNVIEVTLMGNVQEGIYNLFNFYEDNGENLANRGFSTGLSLVLLNELGESFGEGNLIFTDYGQINLELTLIPEPSTWALLVGSLLGVGLYRRRSKLAA